jgi:hypothetical protein
MRGAWLAILIVLGSACSRSLDVPSLDPAFISGRVVQALPDTGKLAPVPAAQVSVPGTNLRGIGDPDGRFTVGPLPLSTYRLLIAGTDVSGHLRQRVLAGVRVAPGLPPLGDVELHQSADVAGRAVLADGANHSVGVIAFVPGAPLSVTTGAEGVYLLRGLPEGPAHIGAFHSGYQGATVDLELQGGVLTTAADLVLVPLTANPPSGALAGTVRVVGRADAGGVQVIAHAGAAPVSTATGTDGRWSLPDLPPGLYAVRFELAGYAGAELVNVLVSSGATTTLDGVLLSPPGSFNLDGGFPDAGTDAGDGGADAGDGGIDGGDGGIDGGDGGIGAECHFDFDCASGRLCEFGRCVGCSSDLNCRAGYRCKGGDCVRACISNAGCTGGLVCAGGLCASCIASADCADPALVCISGACAHCRTGADCAAGRACLAAGCGECGLDSNCDPGKICVQRACVAGDCHDNGMCSGALACIALKCSPCSLDPQCRPGQICLAGTGCTTGCRINSDCQPAGSVCIGNQCGPCTRDSDCVASNVICLAPSCAPGNCHTAADCTGGLGCGPGHFCATCQSNADCGGAAAGRVCNANHICVAGQCSGDPDCAIGFSCNVVTNQCGPNAPFVSRKAAVTFFNTNLYSGTAELLSSDAGLYVGPSGQPMLLVPDGGVLEQRWAGPVPAGSNPWVAPVLAPAQGFPGGELYVGGRSGVGAFAVAGDGVSYWSLAGSAVPGTDFAVGLSGGYPAVAYEFGSNASVIRVDGTPIVTQAPLACTPRTGPAFGTSAIYFLCPTALVAIDPQTGAIRWQLANVSGGAGGGGSVAVNFDDNTPLSIYRPPSATQDVVVFGGHFLLSTVGYTYLYAVKADATSGALSWSTPIAAIDGAASVPLIDAAGAVTVVTKTGAFSRVDANGTRLLTGTASGLGSSYATLASDGTVIGYSAGSVVDVTLQPDAGVTRWRFSFPVDSAYESTWPRFLAFGDLAVWDVQSSVNYTAVALRLPGGVAAPPAPAWPMQGGNFAGQMSAPAYGCASNADCPDPKACVLGRCVFDCQGAADCPGGTACVADSVGSRSHCALTCRDATSPACARIQGCVLNQCAGCVADISCRAGQICSTGTCYDCDGGPGCCRSNADCPGACVAGRCAPSPVLSFIDPSDGGVSLGPDGGVTIGTTATSTIGSDGTIYLIYLEPGTNVNRLAAFDARANLLWTAPLIGGSGPIEPPLVFQRADGGPDSVFWTTPIYAANRVAKVTGGPAGGQTTVQDLSSFAPANNYGGMMAQGISRSGRPAIFGYSNDTLWALDAETLALIWSAITNCAVGSSNDKDILVGSDGTVYRYCDDGYLEAWDPNGLSGTAGNRLWAKYPGGAPLSGTYGRPSIARPRGSASDVLYLPETTPGCPPAFHQIQVSAAGMGKDTRTLFTGYGGCGGDLGDVIDQDGYVYGFRSGRINAIAPDGKLLQSAAFPQQGTSFALADDGLLYAVVNGQVSAFQISPATHQFTQVFGLYGPGGSHYDKGWPLLIPSTFTGTGMPRLLVDLALGTPRIWSAVELGSGAGLMPAPARSTVGGDQLRRNSLKTR